MPKDKPAVPLDTQTQTQTQTQTPKKLNRCFSSRIPPKTEKPSNCEPKQQTKRRGSA